MGCFYNIYLFKDCDKITFLNALASSAAKLSGSISGGSKENHNLRISSSELTHTLLMCSEVYSYIKTLQETLNGPNIAIRIIDVDWGYTLYSGARAIDQFITNPRNFDDSAAFIRKHAGNPALLAKTWNLPKARIANYLRHFDDSLRDRKAYPNDCFEYLECDQYADFLSALGGVEPQTELHQLELPKK